MPGALGVAVAVSVVLAKASLDLVRVEREAATTIGAGIPTWVTQLILPVAFLVLACRLAWLASPRWSGRLIAAGGAAAAEAQILADVPDEPPPDQQVIRPWSKPLYAQGHLAILKGNLATEGGVAKITALKSALPNVDSVTNVRAAAGGGDAETLGASPLRPLLDAAEPDFAIPPTDPEDPALLHFTSGTSGEPKGAVHVHEAVVAHRYTGRAVFDLGPGDVYWCTADPGWVTGTSYGIVAPLACGATMIVDEDELDAERWYRILEGFEVNVWYTAPTAIRLLMRLGTEVARRHLTEVLGEDLGGLADEVHDVRNIGASIASGSFQTDGMIIAPCSNLPNVPAMNATGANKRYSC